MTSIGVAWDVPHPPGMRNPASHSTIDRMRRREAVLGPTGLSGLRVDFEHSLICDNGILIAKFAAHYGITTIYVPVAGDDVSSLLAANPTTVKNLEAMLALANVYLVAGDASWLSTPTTLPPDVASLAQIATMFPSIAGIVYAFDPEASPTWVGQRQATIAAYFTLWNTIQSSPNATAFRSTLAIADSNYATIPAGSQVGAPTMLEELQALPGYGGTIVKADGPSESAQMANLRAALPQLTAPFVIEASISPLGYSYYGRSSGYLAANQNRLAQAVGALNPRLAGTDAYAWSDLFDRLQTILPQPPVFNGTLPTGPLVPPSGTTYLGGYIKPNGTQSRAETLAFETQIGRTLAYNMHFYSWLGAFPGAEEADDVARGRIPVIAWNCGDTDLRIAAGDDDAAIIARADAIKAFGAPIMLRWFWEANLRNTSNPPRTQCYDPKTDFPGGYFAPGPYIAAWSHIRSVFASRGVTNVVWQWCVAYATGGSGQYYPGDDQVDWVAMDDYDQTDVSMTNTFLTLADELSQFQEKPFMITETGAYPENQVNFLTGAASVLQTNFPWARAVGYLDSTGQYHSYTLSTAGVGAFATFANSPYMSAMQSSAPIQVRAPRAHP